MPPEAVLAALHALLKAVAPLKLPVALVGGLALAVWKHARFTQDVDVLIALGDFGTNRLVAALGVAGFRPKRGDGRVMLGSLEILQMLFEPVDAFVDIQVDLLLASDVYHTQALARRVSVNLPGFEAKVHVLTCEDMIIHKLLAGRIIDLADAAALIRANRSSLEINYLLRWIGEQQLDSEWARVWNEALPGEPVPTADI